MSRFTMFIGENWRLPLDKIEEYGNLMSISKLELSEFPKPPASYFVERLTGLLDKEPNGTATNIIGYLDDIPIGWGHISFGTGNCKYSAVYCYIKPAYRNKGYGTKMIKLLLSQTSDSFKHVKAHSLDVTAKYLKKHYGAKVIDTERRYITEVKRIDIHELDRFVSASYKEGKIQYGIIYNGEIDKLSHKQMKEIINLMDDKPKDLETKIEEFKARVVKMRQKMRGKQIIVYAERNGEIIAYNRVIYNFQSDDKTAIDKEFKVVSSALKGIELPIRLKMVEYMQEETDIRHWLFFNPSPVSVSMKHLGLKYLNTHVTSDIRIRF